METQTKQETRQPTCEERIADEAQYRLDDMRRFNHKYRRANEVEEYNAADRLLERQQDRILEVDERKSYKVLLSTGGPADWFEVLVEQDGEIRTIRYHFSDWFDHAERNLIDAEFDTAKAWLRSVVWFGD